MRFGVFIADYETSWPPAARALAAGAAAPPILLSLAMVIMAPASSMAHAAQRTAWMIAVDYLEFFAIVFVPVFFVLFFLGGPVWMLMHARRLRGWGAALLGSAAAAAALALLTAYVLGDNVMSHTFGELLQGNFLIFTPVGALIGLIVWAVAYRRPAPPPSADAAR